jgi:P27 family predicted phage terminase small subunit
MTPKPRTVPLPPAPADLSAQSRAAWLGLAADVEQTLGGAAVDFDALADHLRAKDRLVQVRAVLAVEGLTVSGSKGQTRPHPLLVTESVLRREVAQGLTRLSLDASSRWRCRVDGGRIKRDGY